MLYPAYPADIGLESTELRDQQKHKIRKWILLSRSQNQCTPTAAVVIHVDHLLQQHNRGQEKGRE
jgi:hypothetical protein